MSNKEPMKLSEVDIDRLLDLELPYNKVEELKAAEGVSQRTYSLLGGLFVVCMLILFLPAVLVFTPWFAKLLHFVGYLPEETIMAELNFVSGVFLIFAGIYAAAWLLASITQTFPKFNKRLMLSTIRGMADPNQKYAWAQRWFLRKLIARTVRKAGNEGDFLKCFSRAAINSYTRGVIVIYLISCTFLFFDIRAVAWVVPEGVSLCSYFGGERTLHRWEDATLLTTGCNWKAENKDISYEVHFGEDHQEDLASTNYQTFGMEHFEVLQMVDQALRSSGVPWERDSLGYGKMVKDCYEVHRRVLEPEDQERFNEIYRAGDAAPEGQ